ncbi:hypothetical protein SAY87_030298 [Trapa incisa]|uniref:Uncharacterized protein n=1 Tax=Trapa incisa TaxID=236973 RepID=A0AAN7KM69_9MYRT|nr:hypothetical protein SAY87_030298 [Trapa incisa]
MELMAVPKKKVLSIAFDGFGSFEVLVNANCSIFPELSIERARSGRTILQKGIRFGIGTTSLNVYVLQAGYGFVSNYWIMGTPNTLEINFHLQLCILGYLCTTPHKKGIRNGPKALKPVPELWPSQATSLLLLQRVDVKDKWAEELNIWNQLLPSRIGKAVASESFSFRTTARAGLRLIPRDPFRTWVQDMGSGHGLGMGVAHPSRGEFSFT